MERVVVVEVAEAVRKGSVVGDSVVADAPAEDTHVVPVASTESEVVVFEVVGSVSAVVEVAEVARGDPVVSVDPVVVGVAVTAHAVVEVAEVAPGDFVVFVVDPVVEGERRGFVGVLVVADTPAEDTHVVPVVAVVTVAAFASDYFGRHHRLHLCEVVASVVSSASALD